MEPCSKSAPWRSSTSLNKLTLSFRGRFSKRINPQCLRLPRQIISSKSVSVVTMILCSVTAHCKDVRTGHLGIDVADLRHIVPQITSPLRQKAARVDVEKELHDDSPPASARDRTLSEASK
jgi:hypothetical protein